MEIQQPAGLKIAKSLMYVQFFVGTIAASAVAYLFLIGKVPKFISQFTSTILIPSSIITVGLVLFGAITILSAGIVIYSIANPSVGSWRLSIIFLVVNLMSSISIFSVIALIIMLGPEAKRYFYQSEAEAHFYESKGPFR